MTHRHCILCNVPVGGNSALPSEQDCKTLDRLGMLLHPLRPSRVAANRACRQCARCVVGLQDRLEAFVLRIAAGYLFVGQRLYDLPAEVFRTAPMRKASRLLRDDTFKNTQHGSPDARVDRANLYIHGPLLSTYRQAFRTPTDDHSWRCAWLFAVILMRYCLNDSGAFQTFMDMFQCAFGALLSPTTAQHRREWLKSLVVQAWEARPHNMGYGARVLPHCHMKGQKGSVQELAVDFIYNRALPSKFLTWKLWPWSDATRAARSASEINKATLQFVSSRLCAGKGLLRTVLARDLGWAFGPRVFDVASHHYLGSNAVNGLNRICPAPRRRSKYTSTAARFARVVSHVQLALQPYRALMAFFPEVNSQTVAHSLCDMMQQCGREMQRESRPRRCDEELRRFAKAAWTNQKQSRLAACVKATRLMLMDPEDVVAVLAKALPREATSIAASGKRKFTPTYVDALVKAAKRMK